MHPEPVTAFGYSVSVWNLCLLIGIVVGYAVLQLTFAAGPAGTARPRWLFGCWIATVYVGALGAQWFSYTFDLNTSLVPAPGTSILRYYFDPLAGPKVLYGAVLTLPLTLLAFSRRDFARYQMLLDRWTPAMLATLAVTRIGCFLQGCCYGRRDDMMGIVFPIGSPAYWHQIEEHVIRPGSLPAPVIPTQLLEAVALVVLAFGAWSEIRRGRGFVFAYSVALYSIARIGLEFVRDDPERNLFGFLSTSQWIALAILALFATWRLAAKYSSASQLSPSRL